jgi:ferric-dicitrate binding protein FerR (iron transport regulator)
MDIRRLSDLIEKYKRGECSPQEKELLDNYLESFQNNPDEWNENEMGNQRIIEEKIYSEIMDSINKEKNHYFIGVFLSPSLLKRAASIIFILILVSGILNLSGIFEQKTSSVVWQEKVTSPGEKSVLNLSDGSKVTLNADSKLKYPDHFDNASREVYLVGEAYFEIHHNINRNFIVHTGNLTTTDLGTKFDVSAYPENKTIAVSLLEGKVKVSRNEKGKVGRIAILKPKEQLVYDKENNVSSFNVFDFLEVVGWKDSVYKFVNEPLRKVLPQLERAFGVKFRLTDQSVLAQKITIKFERNSLQTVINVIKSLTGLDYKILKKNNNIKEIVFFRNTK